MQFIRNRFCDVSQKNHLLERRKAPYLIYMVLWDLCKNASNGLLIRYLYNVSTGRLGRQGNFFANYVDALTRSDAALAISMRLTRGNVVYRKRPAFRIPGSLFPRKRAQSD